ncbi:MAG: transporter substrate-binding domain-containing protein [Synergistaceae bacterium]|nr:transporter substrate-binding domain-containing protein [Synergistaceae bacterium]
MNGFPARASDSRRDWRDFVGKSASVVTGSIFDGILQNYFSPSETLYFADNVTATEVVHTGKARFLIDDELVTKKLLQEKRYADLEAFPFPRDMFDSSIGAISANQEMIDAYNAFLNEFLEKSKPTERLTK